MTAATGTFRESALAARGGSWAIAASLVIGMVALFAAPAVAQSFTVDPGLRKGRCIKIYWQWRRILIRALRLAL